MPSYLFLKPKSYPEHEYEIVTTGVAPDDAAALALCDPHEVVARIVETQAMRMDSQSRERMREASAKSAQPTAVEMAEERR